MRGAIVLPFPWKPVYANGTHLGIAVQIAEAFGEDNFNHARSGVYAHANILRQRNQQLAVRRIHHQDRRAGYAFAGNLYVADCPDRGAADSSAGEPTIASRTSQPTRSVM